MFGLILWLLQIVTALFLFAGLYSHLFNTPFTGMPVFDSLFIFCAVVHGLNGFWGIADELFRGKGWGTALKFRNLFMDFSYTRQTGHFMFILHRVTGLIILVYLMQHIFTNSLVSTYLSIENSFITEFLKNDIFGYLAVVSLGFHAFNGVRLIFIELTALTWFQKKTAYLALLFAIFFAVHFTL